MISLVTITRNNFEDLKATLDSLEGCERVASIVINGGDCERTKNYLARAPVSSISEPDRGISDAFNKGLGLAAGHAVGFLNSGDICVDKAYYQEADDAILNGACDVVHANILFDHPHKGQILRGPTQLAGVTYFAHPTLLVSRSLAARVGRFDEAFRIAMDFDYFCRMQLAGFTPRFVDRAVVRMDGTGISSSNETTAIREVVTILRRYKRLTPSLALRYGFMLSKVVVRGWLQGKSLVPRRNEQRTLPPRQIRGGRRAE